MIRYALDPRPGYVEYEITVGWDRPMCTFFAEVTDRASGCVPVDRGDPGDRILDPGVVLDAVRPYAAVPPGLDDDLIRNALNDLASPAPGH